MKNEVEKIILVFAIFTATAFFMGCMSSQPVAMKKPDSVERSYSRDQARAENGVELLIQNKELDGPLVISDVALVRGQYVRQFRARVSNTGRDVLKIRTEPVWFNEHGVQMESTYSQQKTHLLNPGQGISIRHDAASSGARTVRLIIDCPTGDCRVKKD